MNDRFGVTAALQRFLDEAAVLYLDQADVEKLKAVGPDLRIGPLKKAGILTVGQAYTYPQRAMERLPGMGAGYVKEIKKAARDYISEAKKEVPLRVDPENRTPAASRLIQAVASHLKGERVSETEAWDGFVKQSADFYAVMNAFDPYREERTKSRLPEKIAKAVVQQEVNLSYFKGTPRSYQYFGIQYALYEERSLLGDEMGLGKTIQALGMMSHLYARGLKYFLVICPASVLVNWQREVEKFLSIPGYIFHGQDMEEDIHPWMEEGGIGITNFESLGRLCEAWNLVERVTPFPDLVVVDEAHYLKNPGAARTVLAGRILEKSRYALLMTGTPLENRVEEMCQLVSLIRPEFAEELKNMAAYDKATRFEEKAAPVYLRRTREDVLGELPDLIEEDAWCELSKEERSQYRLSVAAGNFMAMRQLSWEMKDPAQSVKAQRLLEICQEARENHRKVIVFSFFRNTLEKVREVLKEGAMEPINGSVPPARRQSILDAFAASEGSPYVLPCQVISGGMGLNIQSASVVVFCEPQIKPSLETQAISRAYRMGQVNSVLVFRLYAKDTVDESIRLILMDKQHIFDEYADPSAVGDESLKQEVTVNVQQLIDMEKEREAE